MSAENSQPIEQVRRSKPTKKSGRRVFLSISLPAPLVEKIEQLIDELGYWPTKTAFVREATIEKLDKQERIISLRKMKRTPIKRKSKHVQRERVLSHSRAQAELIYVNRSGNSNESSSQRHQ
jgi:Arc/MetJ-type ribon-helix-helix transcriptional regulator